MPGAIDIILHPLLKLVELCELLFDLPDYSHPYFAHVP